MLYKRGVKHAPISHIKHDKYNNTETIYYSFYVMTHILTYTNVKLIVQVTDI